MKRLFVVVPSLSSTGPVKGAVALANALARTRPVTFVALRDGPGIDAEISRDIRVLTGPGGFRNGTRFLGKQLEAAGGRDDAAIISFCLSADMTALAARRGARWIASVRGNLPQNYLFDYGRIGPAIAAGHLAALRLADAVVAMTGPMADQIARYIGRSPAIVGNFVDEAPLEQARRPRAGGPHPRVVFLGSLSARKQPLALLDALGALRVRGVDAVLDIVGDGPLAGAVRARADALGFAEAVTVHGHLADPHSVVAGADALVLPSLSEGVSRAVLEALHLGVPVVLRDVDGNREIVDPGINGALFDDLDHLPDAILNAARLRRDLRSTESLLPSRFRQATCTAAYLELAEAI
ncbi:glycosyltransferase [Aurantimonas sp. C2-6-R+9]|uniref:glycosyltransferase n=1 Tax=unclassified Aurantimonas TaxID=2638230 RepID=UPI002E17CFE0|nr:glycosyltransferase [Aurantimonas sp. C2-6-R+9]